MRLRSHSFPKQAPAPQRDGRPALGRRCHAKRRRFFPLSYAMIRALSLGGSQPRRLANLTRETLDFARVRARRGAKLGREKPDDLATIVAVRKALGDQMR